MENTKLAPYLDTLENGKLHSFNEWSEVPKICAGVYTVWREQELIYVGMSGRSMSAETIVEHRNTNSRARGLFTRLKAHASGRRSGDQFCVYVGDKLVLPILTSNEIAEIVNGNLNFDKLIKDYIHQNLSFRFVETENDKLAYELENTIKSGVLKAGKPLLNPL
ncbi:MAG TPA: hypothetical protein VGC76_14100 [Pyrinomonadaceae bacterium]|jgi:hypothetical protein